MWSVGYLYHSLIINLLPFDRKCTCPFLPTRSRTYYGWILSIQCPPSPPQPQGGHGCPTEQRGPRCSNHGVNGERGRGRTLGITTYKTAPLSRASALYLLYFSPSPLLSTFFSFLFFFLLFFLPKILVLNVGLQPGYYWAGGTLGDRPSGRKFMGDKKLKGTVGAHSLPASLCFPTLWREQVWSAIHSLS